ncbi:MAG: rhomboid family intramembrane serine protease [Deltaproteobacteria bacterium]
MFPIQDNMPRRCPPVMTWFIIGVNAFVFFLENGLSTFALDYFISIFGVVPARFTQPGWAEFHGVPSIGYLSLITCMFLHGGWLHIILNMWTLWIFGDNVEDVMGPWRFLAFYMLTGIAASLLHLFANPDSTIPIIGASGAIAGVMGAYYTLFPGARIIMMIPIFFFPFLFEVPAVLFLALWFLLQMVSGTLSIVDPLHAGGIAWWAHVGGFIAGAVLNRLFIPGGRQRTCRRYADEYRPWGIYIK